MYVKQTRIINKMGLHARPASKLVLKAKLYESTVYIRNMRTPGSRPVDVKSVVRILAEGLREGTAVEVMAEGADARKAVDALVELIESGFGEE